ncbi:CopG family antitoxin [Pseudothauera nasutitermitis]|uniref:CopG family antitoxin n=1 Tax=Pseudothauera nasutitermitis TaxID=2565930 RepID=UPI001B3B2CD7|nr:CopG family antitoxin [Pseudothauera nasutitermitis]
MNKPAKATTKVRTKDIPRFISLRLPQHLLDAIKAANARDVPYQSLIKVWLQEKVHDWGRGAPAQVGSASCQIQQGVQKS